MLDLTNNERAFVRSAADNNTLEELKEALTSEPDVKSLLRYGLLDIDWVRCVRAAIDYKSTGEMR